MTTLLQLREAVQDATNRKIGSSVSQVNKLVNDAYAGVVLDGRLNVLQAALTILPTTTGDYSVATLFPALVSILDISFTGSGISAVAVPASRAEIMNLRGNGLTGATPYLYTLDHDILSIYPMPVTGDTASIVYLARPAALVADVDAVDVTILPSEFHDLIELKAMVRSARTIHKGENQQGVQMSQMFQALYRERLLDLKRWRNRTTGTQNPYVQIGPPRRPYNRNDQYWHGDRV